MIDSLIFFGHVLFILIIFSKKWQNENLSAAFLNVGLIGIFFAVGWSLTNVLASLVMNPQGLGIFFTRDTFSLSILSVAEFFFYRMYYKDINHEESGETA
ncbi:MAG: hypothetical protein HUU43_16110 [Ignavibacteriaceae bacterium]|nr:hypothetical protein [Ignavibacteriaceae bacterium]NUM72370.1 hypothetical protein [Ignavibacteriaceae bacterium]